MKGKDLIVVGNYYHIYNRSIANYKIFTKGTDYRRMFELMNYYRFEREIRYSKKDRIDKNKKVTDLSNLSEEKIVIIIAFCLMPTHIHLILKEIKEGGIQKFMMRILNSYSHYFNLTRNRKGPLWESRFKRVLIETDEQLLHLTRYIHLNPTTAEIVEKPEKWKYSSYKEFLGIEKNKICNFEEVLDINPIEYKNFVEDYISYQKEIKRIEHLLLDDAGSSRGEGI